MEFNTDFTTSAPVGAELLSGLIPRWADRVDLRRFRIMDLYGCILGQLYGHYGTGRDLLFGRSIWTAILASETHGFSLSGLPDEWRELRLEAEWEYIIRELRS
jgi:hypothetical protein